MTIDAFVEMTLRVIADEGLDGYLPTLVLPERSEVLVLEGIPENVTDESAAVSWARRTVKDPEAYFLAFKSDDGDLKVVARSEGVTEERRVPVS